MIRKPATSSELGPAVSSAAEVDLREAPPTSPVPGDLRRLVRSRHLASADGRRTTAQLAGVAAIWAATAALALTLDTWWGWAAAWAVLALLTATPLALMHEAVHHNLYRSRTLNHLVGSVAAAVLFFHGPAYRAWHLTHHAYTFEEGDSEQLPDRFASRLHYLAYCLVLGPAFALVLWFGALGTLVGRPPRWIGTPRLRGHVRRWSPVPVVVLGALVAASVWYPATVARLWLIPAVLGSVVMFPLLTMPEHLGGRGHEQLLDNTRTTKSNRFVRFVYWNNNYHAAHHLLPSVPPHNLARVDELIGAHNTMRASGFLSFHRAALAGRITAPARNARSSGTDGIAAGEAGTRDHGAPMSDADDGGERP